MEASSIGRREAVSASLSLASPTSLSSPPKHRDLLPYWNNFTKLLSKELAFSTETDSVPIDLSWSDGVSERHTQGTWFTVACHKAQHAPNQNGTNLPTSRKTTLLSRVLDAMLVDARKKTEERESVLRKAQEKTVMKKQSMTCAAKEKKRKREDTNTFSAPNPARKKQKQRLVCLFDEADSDAELEPELTAGVIQSTIRVKEPPCRVTRYRVFPEEEQMRLLLNTIEATTWTYNMCLYGIQTKVILPTIKACRDYAINSTSPLVQKYQWITKIPYDIRDEAAHDLLRALKANDTKVKKGDRHAANAVFEPQSDSRASKKITIQSKHYKAAGVFCPTFFGKRPFRCNETLPDKIDYAATLTVNWLGQVHFHVPRPLEKHNRPVAPRRVAAIDPGVRTFGTVFDPESNQYTEWGKGDMAKILSIAYNMDRIKSRMDKKALVNCGHRRRYKLKRAFRRLAYRIQNMVNDFHYRFANWLCQNFQVILLPHYEVAKMVLKAHRKIRCKTVRGMLTWSSALFRDRLIGVSRRYTDSHVVPVSEAHTTKTCRCCGIRNHKVGGATIFRCGPCKARYPRDSGGSSGVFLRKATILHEDKSILETDTESSSDDSDGEDDQDLEMRCSSDEEDNYTPLVFLNLGGYE